MRKKGLRFQLSVGFALIVLITVGAVAVLANILIGRQFERYVIARQQEFAQNLADNLGSQYGENGWNVDYVHGFGMYALDDGYIIKLYDADHNSVWDAEHHDMALCHQIMSDIESRMQSKTPDTDSEYVTERFELSYGNDVVGYAEISYYMPYLADESGFDFLQSLNRIILVIGVLAICGAVACGMVYAQRMTAPLKETSDITAKIANGDYDVQFSQRPVSLEISHLQESVHKMVRNLDEQEKHKRKLTRDVAHELRTPLANVSSYLEMMTEGIWQPTNERLNECTQEIERLKGIVGDLEELHSLEDENIKLNRTEFDLLELVRKVAVTFEPSMKDRELTYEILGEPVNIFADEKRIHQAIVNLISNAVKYTDYGDNIIMETTRNEDRVSFSITNHGKLISPEDQKRIFERFYRADDSRSRKTGGAGIGLAIVRAIIAAHDGEVEVISDAQKTRFTITLQGSGII